MTHSRRDVFHAIADPTRRAILSMVANQDMNLNTIATRFSISRPAISQQIKFLEECGLISVEKKGRERICKSKPETLKEVSEWLEPFRKLWEGRFEALDDVLKDLQSDTNS